MRKSLLLVLLVLPVAAAVELEPGECITDANSTITYCAKNITCPAFNETAVYKQCISDINTSLTYIVEMNSSLVRNYLENITKTVNALNITGLEKCISERAALRVENERCENLTAKYTDVKDKLNKCEKQLSYYNLSQVSCEYRIKNTERDAQTMTIVVAGAAAFAVWYWFGRKSPPARKSLTGDRSVRFG